MGWLRCYRCKEQFALTDDVEETLRRNHQTFHCPWGHPQHFVEGETEEQKLRREVNQLRQNKAYLEDRRREAEEQAKKERYRANGYKGHATRISKRVKAGVCICCNRTFQNLADHMATKHPTFTPLEVEQDGATVQ
jgi:hypothetical protein